MNTMIMLRWRNSPFLFFGGNPKLICVSFYCDFCVRLLLSTLFSQFSSYYKKVIFVILNQDLPAMSSSETELMEVENENQRLDSQRMLKYLNLVTWGKIVGDEHSCWRLLHSFDLVPSQSLSPSCPNCDGSMSVDRNYQNKIGWRWRCNKRGGKRSKKESCSGSINPMKGTLLEQVCISCNIKAE